VDSDAFHATLAIPWMAIHVYGTSASVVMAQPRPAWNAQQMVIKSAFHAVQVSQMLVQCAPHATRTLVAHASGCLAMVGVLVPFVIPIHTNASVLLDNAVSMENAAHLLNVPKSQAQHAWVLAALVNVRVQHHLDFARATWTSVPWRINV